MLTVKVNEQISSFVKFQAPRFDIGGMSNLGQNDLNKASRLDFQYTGLYGESAWYQQRYGSLTKLSSLLDYKYETFTNTGKGDEGEDDSLIINGEARKVDIKTSHVIDPDRIRSLNLIVPMRELHKDMIYISAFTVGPERTNVEKVLFAGWVFNEDIKDRFHYDESKFAVKVKDLRPISTLLKVL